MTNRTETIQLQKPLYRNTKATTVLYRQNENKAALAETSHHNEEQILHFMFVVLHLQSVQLTLCQSSRGLLVIVKLDPFAPLPLPDIILCCFNKNYLNLVGMQKLN